MKPKLIAQSLNGNTEAYGELVDRYKNAVVAMVHANHFDQIRGS